VQPLARPAVAAGPVRARRTGGSFVIDAFFVWTADNPVSHHDGSGSSPVYEREHFCRNSGIIADIGLFGEPASKVRNVGRCGASNAGQPGRGQQENSGSTACTSTDPEQEIKLGPESVGRLSICKSQSGNRQSLQSAWISVMQDDMAPPNGDGIRRTAPNSRTKR